MAASCPCCASRPRIRSTRSRTTFRRRTGKKHRKDYEGRNKAHTLFVVEASAPDTTLEIEVTDSFGKVYRETMERPKAFCPMMK